MNTILLEHQEGIGIIRLNRPQVHHAIDGPTMEALQHAVSQFNADASIRAVMLATTGGETFCAGGDLRYFATLRTREAGRQMSRTMQAILMQIEEAPKPYIAAIQGNAFGGGCELALACHFRVMAEGKHFAFRQVANGIITGWGGGRRLFRLVPPAVALHWLTSAQPVDAVELHRRGVVHEVVAPDTVEERSRELAKHVLQMPEAAVQAILRLYRNAMEGDWAAFAELETELFADLWVSPFFRNFLERWVK